MMVDLQTLNSLSHTLAILGAQVGQFLFKIWTMLHLALRAKNKISLKLGILLYFCYLAILAFEGDLEMFLPHMLV